MAAVAPAAVAPAPVFLNIRHQKTTLFVDALETTPIYEVKRIVEGIIKKAPEEQKLYKDGTLLQDGKTLKDYDFTQENAGPHEPRVVGLALSKNDKTFEEVQIADYTKPV